jgi:hypothetical protein
MSTYAAMASHIFILKLLDSKSPRFYFCRDPYLSAGGRPPKALTAAWLFLRMVCVMKVSTLAWTWSRQRSF